MVYYCLSEGEKAKQNILGLDGHLSTKAVRLTPSDGLIFAF